MEDTVKDVVNLYYENSLIEEKIFRYKNALTKIAYIENEWDDPLDFIKDLKDIAKEALIN